MTIEEQARQVAEVKSYGLICAAAIGVKDVEERAKALVKSGLEIIVIDIAHGHSKYAGKTLDYLKEKFGTADPEVLRAFSEVPREYFQYQYQNNRSFAETTYENKISKIKPWAIGWGSALSGGGFFSGYYNILVQLCFRLLLPKLS